jgi:hypothetical protein
MAKQPITANINFLSFIKLSQASINKSIIFTKRIKNQFYRFNNYKSFYPSKINFVNTKK